jgi:hypothetical protein
MIWSGLEKWFQTLATITPKNISNFKKTQSNSIIISNNYELLITNYADNKYFAK